VPALGALGNKATVDFSLNPIRNDDGEVAFLIAEGRDISDLYNAKQSLMESEEKFRQIAENVNDGFFILDIITDQYLYANKSLGRVTK
jgi:PAS domain-containing protein